MRSCYVTHPRGAWQIGTSTSSLRESCVGLQVYVKGNTVWKNPKGYLPGARQKLLPFHASISFLYLILAGTWLSMHLFNHGHISAAQHLVTLCVGLGMLESCLDYADFYTVNSSGFLSPALTMAGIAAAATFHTCVRASILLLARGFGTFRPAAFDRNCAILGARPCCSMRMHVLHPLRRFYMRSSPWQD